MQKLKRHKRTILLTLSALLLGLALGLNWSRLAHGVSVRIVSAGEINDRYGVLISTSGGKILVDELGDWAVNKFYYLEDAEEY